LSENKSAQLTRRLGRAESSAAGASQAMKAASVAGNAFRALPVVFAALDVASAYSDLRKEW
jgi:hypothetical protein